MLTIVDTIGQTPLVQLQRLTHANEARIGLKCERSNPGGSVKDRPARFIIETAERAGWLSQGGTIIESSSGNFGISLAMLGAAKGYRVIILVDPKITPTNLALLEAYGAEVEIVTEQDDSGSYHKTRIARANELARQIRGAFRPDQCFNLLNSEAHANSTAREILVQGGDSLAMVIAAVSTGGQLGGILRQLKLVAPHVQVVGVDAVGSAIFGGAAHSYLMPGVGLGWTPANLPLALLDHAFNVPDEAAFLACRTLARHEGIMVGASSGAVLLAAMFFAQQMPAGAQIVAIAADSGERYLQTVYNDAWLADHGLGIDCSPAELRARARNLRPCAFHEGQVGTVQANLAETLQVPASTQQMNQLVQEQWQQRSALQLGSAFATRQALLQDVYC
ncbi:cysteine synthase family protein [Herpetosiphon llansteffanensis]|uniref:cysteine synthase family protein n=1 Tax=Herpetosiphon llansteffanensis TaxID=2094568 RepID=UPI000D7C4D61|nr:cysteine synthase family protein [Herpetosiphon llansteffanensis]